MAIGTPAALALAHIRASSSGVKRTVYRSDRCLVSLPLSAIAPPALWRLPGPAPVVVARGESPSSAGVHTGIARRRRSQGGREPWSWVQGARQPFAGCP